MDEPRIPPAAPPFGPEADAVLAQLTPPGAEPLRLFRTLGQNPRVLARFLAGGLLDRGSIGLRERELAILRTCARCGSEYEWGVHVAVFSARAGLSEDEVRATCLREPLPASFGPRDRAVLALCDALHDRADVGDALWRELAAQFEPAQLVELIVLAGFYHTVSFATNALRIELEPGVPRFPA
ncbi:MAG TPA: carboxymuconolactone decarboxylase family protein [Myxococcota bacterium]|nr:carboxymuconolactone decarboxylase family protein [Myxococcota bacterium]